MKDIINGYSYRLRIITYILIPISQSLLKMIIKRQISY
nr:MAG TPA: hypothetical protein [Caudoviricetes sp.]